MIAFNFFIATAIIVWVTLALLITCGVAFIIMARTFYELYVRKHIELEQRLTVLEQSHNGLE